MESLYFILFFQDYHWWWRSFLTSGFTAFYLLAYCVHFFMTKLDIEDATSTFLYFGYTFIMVYLFFLLTGKFFLFSKKSYFMLDTLSHFSVFHAKQVQSVSSPAFGLYGRFTVWSKLTNVLVK